ncbi:prealbumin-like fold domain-containing protein [Butyrivibrio sp. AD3002]|uniref:prealbumin-like fold domain-containing protein n=1 Tax=Butyrivibrio sp. AD3002 TaxID=1280670 RepID=UPI0003B663CE|nr:prealbumin-like fold domain-containing protein [Butyrivibrio sp. AD3002]
MKKVGSTRNILRGRNKSKGFTVAELLIVVAILLALVAFGVVAGIRIIRNMRQSHLDKRAEAVYYAAESRMMELFVTENKTEVTENDDGEEVTKAVVETLYSARRFTNEDGTFAYITSDEDSAAKALFTNDRTLEVELGSDYWIIEYDPVSLDIYAVILSENLEKAGTDLASLTCQSASAPLRGTPEDRIAAYNSYVGYYSEGANNGAGAAAKSGLRVGAWILNRRELLGVIKISADEKTRRAIENLSFKVSLSGEKSESEDIDISANEIFWQNYAQDEDSNFLETDGKTGIVITTSDIRTTIPATCFGAATDNNGRYALIGYVKLDSLDKKLQFKDIKAGGTGGKLGSSITPGDDITLSVKVWDSGDGSAKYSENVRGASAISAPENSLFADFDVKNGISVAEIVYPRHLQNLDYEFSHVKANMAAGEGTGGEIAAVLLEDIEWDEEENLSKDKVRNFTPINNEELVSFNGLRFDDPEEAVPLGDANSIKAEDPEKENGQVENEESKYHFIKGLRIDTSDSSYALIGSNRNIGLFGVQPHLTVANLILTDFDIKNTVGNQATGMLAGKLENSTVKNIFVYNTFSDAVAKKVTGTGSTAGLVGEMTGTSVDGCVIKNIVVDSAGNAGALAGKVSGGGEIRNVLAYNGELSTTGGDSARATTAGFDDSTYEITGSQNVGGLIGEMEGGTLTGCSAALYVRAASGNSGGLIGKAGSGASINMCQSGGHTITDSNGQAGKYDKSTAANTRGRVNVIGASSAGGFVGTSSGATIQNSYTTCSVSAATVGGFAGSADGGNIANCYAACQVFFENEGTAGGFIGSGGGGAVSNHYFEIINPTTDGKYLKGIGGTEKDDKDKTKAIDDEILDDSANGEYEYNKFMIPRSDLTIARGEKTHRYEMELQPAIYTMKFASQLSNITSNELFYTDSHYGDWPIVEQLVINSGTSIAERPKGHIDPFAKIKAMASDISNSNLIRTLAEAVITEPIPETEKEETTQESTEQNTAEQNTAEQNTAEQNTAGGTESTEEAAPSNEEAAETPEESGSTEASVEENEAAPAEAESTQSESAENTEEQAPAEENGSSENAGEAEAAEAVTPEENPAAEENAQSTEEMAVNPEEAVSDIIPDNTEKSDPNAEEALTNSGEIKAEIEEEEDESVEGVLVNEDKGISISFGKDAKIPEGAELEVIDIAEDSEDYDYAQLVNDATEAMEITTEDVASVRALDIAIVKDGEEIQPQAPVTLEIKTEQLYQNNELFVDDQITAVHMTDDEPELIETTVTNEAIEEGIVSDNPASNDAADSLSFETDGFSVYVIVQPIQQKKVYTTDDNVYTITVDYDNASGIPANAELVVSEVTSDTEEYAGYVEESAQAAEAGSELIKLARVFDISFVDSESGDTYQPSKDVKVSIQLMQDEVCRENEEIRIVHFGDETKVVDSSVNENVIEFNTDGFSVYTMVEIEWDAFDASLANKKYYISFYDGANTQFLSRTGTTLTSDTNKDNVTPWEFTTYADGYHIHYGDNYIGVVGTAWGITDKSGATVFTASDMGNCHWICKANSTDAQKYIGYTAATTDFNTITGYTSLGGRNDLLLNEAEDVSDSGINGDAYFIRDSSGSNYLKIDGTSLGSTATASDATSWEFLFVRNGYKIRKDTNYIGKDPADPNKWIITTNSDDAAVFTACDMGTYHYVAEITGDFLGYNATDGFARRYTGGVIADNQLIVSETADGADFIDKTYDGKTYYISRGEKYLDTTTNGTDNPFAAAPWTFTFNDAKGGYLIHQGSNYLTGTTAALGITTTEASADAFVVGDMGTYHIIGNAQTATNFMGYSSSSFNMTETGATSTNAQLILSTNVIDNVDKALDGKEFYVITYDGWYLTNYNGGTNEKRYRQSVPNYKSYVSRWTFTSSGSGYYIHNGNKYFAVNADKTLSIVNDTTAASTFIVSDMGSYHLIKDTNNNYLGHNILQAAAVNKASINASAAFDSQEARFLLVDDISLNGDFIIFTKRETGNEFYRALLGEVSPYKAGALKGINISDPPFKQTTSTATTINDPNEVLTVWHFEKVEGQLLQHYISCNVGGSTKYLSIKNGNVSLSDAPEALVMAPRLEIGTEGLPTTRTYRILSTTITDQCLRFNASNRDKPYYETSTSIEDILSWHYISSAQPMKTVHYIYNQDPGDKGTADKLSPVETIVFQGDSIVLKQPKVTKYISKGEKYTHAYIFKGWRDTATGTIYNPGDTVDISARTENAFDFESLWEYDPDTVIVEYVIPHAQTNYGYLIDANGNRINELPMAAVDDSGNAIPDNTEMIIGETETHNYKVRDIRNTTESDSRLYHMYQRLKTAGNDNYRTYEFKYWQADNGDIIKPGDTISLEKYMNDEGVVTLTAQWVYEFQNGTMANVSFSIIRIADVPDNTYTDADELVAISEELSQYAVHVGGTIMHGVNPDGSIQYPDEFKSPTNPNVKYWMIAPYSDRNLSTEREVLKTDNAIRYELYGDGYTDDGYMENKFHQLAPRLSSDVRGTNNYDPNPTTLRNNEIHKWSVPYLPSDEKALSILRNKQQKVYLSKADADADNYIPFDELTPDNYTLRWYFVKYQSSDEIGFHIDGKLTKKESYITITKTFKEPTTINAIEGIMDNAKNSYDNNDSLKTIGQKLTNDNNKCFYIRLDDNQNKNHVVKLALYDRTRKDDTGKDVARVSEGELGAYSNIFGYIRRNDSTDADGNKLVKLTWVVAFDEYEKDHTFTLTEKNYNFTDEVKKVSYGIKLQHNKTGTGNADDEKLKDWDPETDTISTSPHTPDVEFNPETSVANNLFNTYAPGSILSIKKVDGNQKNDDGSEKTMANVEFRVFEVDGDGKEDQLKLYKLDDGKYTIFFENDATVVNEAKTDKDGLLDITMAASAKENKVKTYVIKETIPEGYVGYQDYVNPPQFKITIDDNSKITLKKDDVKVKPAYGKIEPCDKDWKRVDYENDKVITNYIKVINGGTEEVFFKKIDGDGKVIAGAKFKIYDTAKTGDNNTLADVLAGNGKAYENITIKDGDKDVTTDEVVSIGEAIPTSTEDKKANVIFSVPVGTYYMVETAAPKDYEADYYLDKDMPKGADPDLKEGEKYKYHDKYVYRITVGNDNVKLLKGYENSEETFVIQRMIDEDTADTTLDVAKYGIININLKRGKLLLKKVDGEQYPLSGKEFEILRPDKTVIASSLEELKKYQSGNGALGTMQKRKSGDGGAFYIGKLSLGTYYLHEISPEKWYKIEVTEVDGYVKPIITDTTNPFTE